MSRRGRHRGPRGPRTRALLLPGRLARFSPRAYEEGAKVRPRHRRSGWMNWVLVGLLLLLALGIVELAQALGV